MVWPRVKEGGKEGRKEGRKAGRGGYHHEDDNYTSAGQEKKGRPKKIWINYIREDMKECGMMENMAEG